jgi:hypothetical protein
MGTDLEGDQNVVDYDEEEEEEEEEEARDDDPEENGDLANIIQATYVPQPQLPLPEHPVLFREMELELLRQALGKPGCMAIVSGGPGMGRKSVIREYLQREGHNYDFVIQSSMSLKVQVMLLGLPHNETDDLASILIGWLANPFVNNRRANWLFVDWEDYSIEMPIDIKAAGSILRTYRSLNPTNIASVHLMPLTIAETHSMIPTSGAHVPDADILEIAHSTNGIPRNIQEILQLYRSGYPMIDIVYHRLVALHGYTISAPHWQHSMPPPSRHCFVLQRFSGDTVVHLSEGESVKIAELFYRIRYGITATDITALTMNRMNPVGNFRLLRKATPMLRSG